MKIDMHIHTIVSSPCSAIDPVECIEKAIHAGLDAICVTEHGTVEGGHVVREIASGYKGIRVFAGIEVMCREGHMLVYGYEEDIIGVKPVEDVKKLVESAGGILIPAHPWRSPFGWYDGSLDRPIEETDFPKLFKVIEMYNGQQSIIENQRGETYCREMGIPGIGGSDAHIIECVGCVITEFEDEIVNEKELVQAIREGNFKAELRPEYYKLIE